jgi:ribonucleoside-diphosphate reductase alpha chain
MIKIILIVKLMIYLYNIDLVCSRAYEIITTISHELPKTYDREIPERFFKGNTNKICGFLQGLYTANGSVVSNRVSLKASSLSVIKQVQSMLSAVGIMSYYTTNKSSVVEFSNGIYNIKQSYDLQITSDIHKFDLYIGFIQKYKTIKLRNQIINKVKTPKQTYEIKEIKDLGIHKVYDITVDCDEHTYWTNGLLVSNCGEVLFTPVTKDGICGVQIL